MWQILKEPKLNFVGWGPKLMVASVALVLISLAVLPFKGLNLGIEFTGGVELQVKYAEKPDLGTIRSQLGAAGLGSPTVTTIGPLDAHEVDIRLASRGAAEGGADPTTVVLDILRGSSGAREGRAVDLNIADERTLAELLQQAPGLGSEQAKTVAAALVDARRQGKIFRDFNELEAFAGMTPAVRTFLEPQATIGPLTLRSQSYIGPAVGSELMKKAFAAIALSLLGMLAYIWFRFKLEWGVAAVAALVHDTIVTLALFSLVGEEMGLPVIAAFLTLVGYSVNDTVVVFDRIRENMAIQKGRSLPEIFNLSLNQTLSRTLITSGATWIVVMGLFLFGGEALRPFSFVLTAGIIVGTYSSISIASPMVLMWYAWKDRRKQGQADRPQPAGERKAKKVRRTNAG